MKIILDECLPRRLKEDFKDFSVTTVQDQGWSGKKNGALMKLIEGMFDVFVTVDRNLTFQVSTKKFAIGVVVLAAPTNRYADLQLLMPKVLKLLPSIKPGQTVEVL